MQVQADSSLTAGFRAMGEERAWFTAGREFAVAPAMEVAEVRLASDCAPVCEMFELSQVAEAGRLF